MKYYFMLKIASLTYIVRLGYKVLLKPTKLFKYLDFRGFIMWDH